MTDPISTPRLAETSHDPADIPAFLDAWERAGCTNRIEYVRLPGEHYRVLLASEIRKLVADRDRLTAELAKAREDQQWLAALEAAGVDNWVGYDTARQLQREADLKTGTHTYDVIVWLMEDNRIFGADGWTWCKVIDGDPDDYTGDLPRCADEADARAKAAAWLASVTAADPTAQDPA